MPRRLRILVVASTLAATAACGSNEPVICPMDLVVARAVIRLPPRLLPKAHTAVVTTCVKGLPCLTVTYVRRDGPMTRPICSTHRECAMRVSRDGTMNLYGQPDPDEVLTTQRATFHVVLRDAGRRILLDESGSARYEPTTIGSSQCPQTIYPITFDARG